MNKKMTLILVALLGISSLTHASEGVSTNNLSFWDKVTTFLSKVSNYSLNLPALLLQKISPKRFEGMSIWKAAAFDVVTYVMICIAIKIAYDKYQARQKRLKTENAIGALLAKFEEEPANEEDIETVETTGPVS